jgi:hypothetical protein
MKDFAIYLQLCHMYSPTEDDKGIKVKVCYEKQRWPQLQG